MEFKDKVKTARENLNKTLEEVAKEVGVSAATISRYESGEIVNVRRDKIEILAKALNVTPAYLMGWKENSELELVGTLEPMDTYKYIDAKVAAGYPTPVEAQNYKEISIPRKFLGQYADNPNIIIMKTYGESMNKIIPSDSLIGILPFYSIFDIQNGDIVVFRDRDYDYAVKRFFKYEDKIVFRSESTDSRFTDIVYETLKV